MNKKEIEGLLVRYLSAREENRDTYFDADEMEELLNSFELNDDYTFFDEVLSLGLRLHPQHIGLLVRKGRQLLLNEKYDETLSLIEEIREANNEDIDLLELECYCLLKNYEKVSAITLSLIENKAEYLEFAFEFVAPILNEMEMFNKAYEYIQWGLDLFPANMILKEELCFTHENRNDFSSAIEICNELLDKNPYSFIYWLLLGRLYSLNGEYDKAIEALDFALTCDDSDLEVKLMRAYCLFMNESYEKALQIYEELYKESNDPSRIALFIAECYFKTGTTAKAYDLLKEILQRNEIEDDPSLHILYARCCVQMERIDEAVEILNKAAALFPNNINVLSLLATCYMDLGEENKFLKSGYKMLQVLDNSEDNWDQSGDILFSVGQYLFMNLDYERALLYFEKAYEKMPELPYIHFYIAMLSLACGKMDLYSEHYKKIDIQEILHFMKKQGMDFSENEFLQTAINNPLLSIKLANDYLNNKENRN